MTTEKEWLMLERQMTSRKVWARVQRVSNPKHSPCERTSLYLLQQNDEYPQSLPRGGEDERLTQMDNTEMTQLRKRTRPEALLSRTNKVSHEVIKVGTADWEQDI